MKKITKSGLFMFCLVSWSYAIGVKNNMLAPCNEKMNCAISQKVHDQKPNVQPIAYTGSSDEAKKND